MNLDTQAVCAVEALGGSSLLLYQRNPVQFHVSRRCRLCDVWRCCSTATLGRKNVGSTVHYAYPIVIMTTLESLVREGIKNQRRQLQRYVVARDSRFVCTVCESQQVQHPGWSGPEFNQDNVLGHFKTKHREITIYSHEQFDNARKRVLQVSQPAITTKFPKIEKTTGVDQAVQLMRKLPGTPLSNFDSEDFKRPWADWPPSAQPKRDASASLAKLDSFMAS